LKWSGTNALVWIKSGVTFLFAPHITAAYAMRRVRKQLAIRTIFTILGPLVNLLGRHYVGWVTTPTLSDRGESPYFGCQRLSFMAKA
jgi:hypothetical protein